MPEAKKDAAYYAMRNKNTLSSRRSREKKRRWDVEQEQWIEENFKKLDELERELRNLEEVNQLLKTLVKQDRNP